MCGKILLRKKCKEFLFPPPLGDNRKNPQDMQQVRRWEERTRGQSIKKNRRKRREAEREKI